MTSKWNAILTGLLVLSVGCDSGTRTVDACGDGFVDPGEECDGDTAGQTCASLGFYSTAGVLRCTSGCLFDTSECGGWCGDAQVQGEEEDCDGLNLNGHSCESLGYYGGTLFCLDGCAFDLSGCEVFGRCGDDAVQAVQSEVCDGADLAGETCESLGYHGGQLACAANCRGFDTAGCEAAGRCQDGILQSGAGEECDGEELDGEICESLGYHGGTLACASDCTLDVSDCVAVGRCGDGVVQAVHGEACDGEELGGATCELHGFHEGVVGCDDHCELVFDGCGGRCGDAVLQGTWEDCDGLSLGGEDCASQGHYPGTLNCDDLCAFDFSECGGFCGDDLVQGAHGEVCDGTALQGAACADVGFFFGEPACAGDCSGIGYAACRDVDLIGTTEHDAAGKIAVGGSGDLYATGSVGESLDGQAHAGVGDAFLVRYSAGGRRLWTRLLGTAGEDAGFAAAVDGAGNVFVTGETEGVFPGQVSAGEQDAFLAKYDADGHLLWVRQWGSSGWDGAVDLVLDPAGDVYVTGYAYASIDSQPFVGEADLFLARFDSDGTRLWVRMWGSAGHDRAAAMVLDPAGNPVVAGHADGSINGQPYTGYDDILVLKVDPDGTPLWTRMWGNATGNDRAEDLGVDSAGDLYVTGFTMGGLEGQVAVGYFDAFLTRLDGAGTRSWTRQWGTTDYDEGQALLVDGGGRIQVFGTTQGEMPGQTAAGSNDFFLSEFTDAGVFVQTRQWGSNDYDVATDLVELPVGALILAGTTMGNLLGQVITGENDAFLFYLP